jgi:hypothetical protein
MGRTKYGHRGRATDGTHQRDGAGVGFGALESGLLDQKCGNDPVNDLQDGRSGWSWRQTKGRSTPSPWRHVRDWTKRREEHSRSDKMAYESVRSR